VVSRCQTVVNVVVLLAIQANVSNMDTIYFDWGGGKLTTLKNDEDEIRYFPSCDKLLDSLTEPTYIISEATFESFDVSRRIKVIEKAKRAGHIWKTTPNRLTGRYRRGMGIDDKSDEIDVTVIRSLAKAHPEVLKSPNVRLDTDPLVIGLKQVNDELMVLRRTQAMVESKRSKLGWKIVSAKDVYADEIIAFLPDSSTLTDIQHIVLCGTPSNKSKPVYHYSRPLIAAVAKATKYAKSRKEFEHYTGLFVHGYPSQIRSDVYHWSWRFARDRGATLTDFRRECRWLYHQLSKIRDKL
jgi:hypothetical protein